MSNKNNRVFIQKLKNTIAEVQQKLEDELRKNANQKVNLSLL